MIEWLEKKRVFALILTILIAIEIFYFSSLSGGTGTGGGIKGISIIYHFVVFFLFTFFLLVASVGKEKIKPKQIIIVLIISTIYAILDEIHQIFVPFREPTVRDVLTDTLGIFSSTIIYLYYKRNKIKRV